MSKHASDTSSMELSHYGTILRRRWKYVVAGFAVGLGLASFLVVTAETRSTALTQVNVNLISTNAFSAARPASDLLDIQTEQAMARSTSVMSDVAEELGGSWTKSSVRGATAATLLPDGTVMRIEFTAGSAKEAATGASLVAEKYLNYRSDEAQGRLDVASESLVSRRNTLNRQLSAANQKVLESEPGSPQELSAEVARQSVVDELDTVTAQLNELRGINTGGGSVVTEADPEQVQTSPNRPLILGSGLFGGVLLGLIMAFVVNVLDRHVRDSYDVAGAGGGVTVARLRGASVALPAEGEDGDQVRALRERLLAAVKVARPVVTLIEVGARDRLPSDLAPNLALALADSGMTTDLVLADFPDTALEAILAALDFSEVDSVGSVQRFRGEFAPSLTVLVPRRGTSRLTTDDVVADLLVDGVRGAEVTVVGVAQAAGPAVRLAAGRFAHQVVLVTEEMSTRIDDLAGVVTDLTAVWAEIHGTVVVPRGRHYLEAGDAARGQDTNALVSPAAAGDVEEWSTYVEAADPRERVSGRSASGDQLFDQQLFDQHEPEPEPVPARQERDLFEQDRFEQEQLAGTEPGPAELEGLAAERVEQAYAEQDAELDHPESDHPEADSAEPDPAESDHAEPDPAESDHLGTAEVEDLPADPESPDAEVSEGELAAPEPAEADSVQPDAEQPEAEQPEAEQSEQSEPGFFESVYARPSVDEFDADHPTDSDGVATGSANGDEPTSSLRHRIRNRKRAQAARAAALYEQAVAAHDDHDHDHDHAYDEGLFEADPQGHGSDDHVVAEDLAHDEDSADADDRLEDAPLDLDLEDADAPVDPDDDEPQTGADDERPEADDAETEHAEAEHAEAEHAETEHAEAEHADAEADDGALTEGAAVTDEKATPSANENSWAFIR